MDLNKTVDENPGHGSTLMRDHTVHRSAAGAFNSRKTEEDVLESKQQSEKLEANTQSDETTTISPKKVNMDLNKTVDENPGHGSTLMRDHTVHRSAAGAFNSRKTEEDVLGSKQQSEKLEANTQSDETTTISPKKVNMDLNKTVDENPGHGSTLMRDHTVHRSAAGAFNSRKTEEDVLGSKQQSENLEANTQSDETTTISPKKVNMDLNKTVDENPGHGSTLMRDHTVHRSAAGAFNSRKTEEDVLGSKQQSEKLEANTQSDETTTISPKKVNLDLNKTVDENPGHGSTLMRDHTVHRSAAGAFNSHKTEEDVLESKQQSEKLEANTQSDETTTISPKKVNMDLNKTVDENPGHGSTLMRDHTVHRSAAGAFNSRKTEEDVLGSKQQSEKLEANTQSDETTTISPKKVNMDLNKTVDENPGHGSTLMRDHTVHRSAAGAFNSRKTEEDVLESKQQSEKLEANTQSDETTTISLKKEGRNTANRLNRISLGCYMYMYLEWMLHVRLCLCLLYVSAASGDCNIESKAPDCYKYHPYRQEGVPYGDSSVLATFPGTNRYVLKIVWLPVFNLQQFDCSNISNYNCLISTLGPKTSDTCQDLNPSIYLETNLTHVTVRANVMEEAQYCVVVDTPHYYWVHQGGVFPITNPTTNPTDNVLVANEGSTNSLRVTWTAPADATAHEVTWSPPDSTGTSGDRGVIDEYTITGLTPGTLYNVTVTANSTNDTMDGTGQGITLPSAVTLVELPATNDSISAQWSKPDGIVDQYLVSCSEDTVVPPSPVIEDGSDTYQASCMRLSTAGADYTITVTSQSGTEMSSDSSLTITALPNAVQIVAGESTNSSYEASWNHPEGEIDSFQVFCYENDPTPEEITNVSSTNVYEVTCESLPTAGTSYQFSVVSVSRDKNATSQTVLFTIPNPVDLIEGDSTIDTVSASWNKPAGMVTSYEIGCREGEAMPPTVDQTGDGPFTASCENLTNPGDLYTINVTSLSNGERSVVATIDLRAWQGDRNTVSPPKFNLNENSKNHASADCGAMILGNNPEAQSASAILNNNRDIYMMNPCSAKSIWFIVELCEPIQVKLIELANYELFSCVPESFKVSISDRYPVREWHLLGTFVARNERTLQNFPLNEETMFAKYMKIEMLTFFGSEHFCLLSVLRVFGTSTVEEIDDAEGVNSVPSMEQVKTRQRLASRRGRSAGVMQEEAPQLSGTRGRKRGRPRGSGKAAPAEVARESEELVIDMAASTSGMIRLIPTVLGVSGDGGGSRFQTGPRTTEQTTTTKEFATTNRMMVSTSPMPETWKAIAYIFIVLFIVAVCTCCIFFIIILRYWYISKKQGQQLKELRKNKGTVYSDNPGDHPL